MPFYEFDLAPFVKALDQAGYTIVPKELTGEMKSGYNSALRNYYNTLPRHLKAKYYADDNAGFYIGDRKLKQNLRWKAMLRFAPKLPVKIIVEIGE